MTTDVNHETPRRELHPRTPPRDTEEVTQRPLRARWERLPRAWRSAIVATLVLRVALAIGAFAVGGVLEPLPGTNVAPVPGTDFAGWEGRGVDELGSGLIGAGLERQDALWYLAIARSGYPEGTPDAVPGAGAFFPLYPLLVGLLGRLFAGSYLVAASLISLAATVAAIAGVHRLVEAETGDAETARRAAISVALFPTAFFLVAPFTESLFLALSVWAFVWARRGRWVPVVGLTYAAALTRNVGVLLTIPLLLEILRQRREGRPPGTVAWVAAIGAAPLGLLTFCAYLWTKTDTFLAPLRAQGGWQRVLTPFWESLANAVSFGTNTPGQAWTGYHSLDLIVFIPVVAAVVWLVARAPLPYGAYAVAHLIVWLSLPFPDRPLMSTPRFALAVAPLFWGLAALTRRQGWDVAWWGASAALLGVHALLFIDWYFVF